MCLTAAATNHPGAGMVVLIGLVVVFSVLLLLTFVFWLFGKIAGNNGSANTPAVKPTTKIAPSAPAPSTPPVIDGVSDEIVAVIAAAVATMSSEGTQYTIRRIRPASVHGVHPVWAAAGIAENTRPF